MHDELKLMSELAYRLEPLDPAARSRVLGWVTGALGVPTPSNGGAGVIAGKVGVPATPSGEGGFSPPQHRSLSLVEEWLFDEQDYNEVDN